MNDPPTFVGPLSRSTTATAACASAMTSRTHNVDIAVSQATTAKLALGATGDPVVVGTAPSGTHRVPVTA